MPFGILELPIVRIIDLPPQVDLDVAPLLEATVLDLGEIEPPDEDAPLVAILDTGVNNGHPLLAPVVVDRVAVPTSLGISDVFGHGSRVSGIAAYGDVRDCLENGNFQSSVRILSGKIVNDQGNLDDRRLIASQVNEIVRQFHTQGCRIFNLSMGGADPVRMSLADFEARYQVDPDPWRYASSEYEHDKYEATLAACGNGPFADALELGASIGVYTELLAPRCERLTTIDGAPTAVAAARRRLAGATHVDTILGEIPDSIPIRRFDLVVASEILYYLTAAELAQTLGRLESSMIPGGRLVATHWRPPDRSDRSTPIRFTPPCESSRGWRRSAPAAPTTTGSTSSSAYERRVRTARGGRRARRAVCGASLSGRRGRGAVGIVTDEHRMPYNRPPLTKELLRGESSEDELPIESEAWLHEQDVRLLSGRAVSLNPDDHVVALSGGRELRYRSCVLATGAEPTRLPIPGADHPAVRVIRTLDHVRELAGTAAGTETPSS